MAQFSSWDSYFWEPGGSVLRNLYGERDGSALAKREYAETSKQQTKIEMGLTPISRTYDAEHVRAIHAQLFGNVYEWAGEYRTVGLRKNLSEFAHPEDVPGYLAEASRLVRGAEWSSMGRDEFATSAAEVFAHVNQAHPFREGNGRAGKLFMQHVSELSRFRIDYSPAVSGVTPEYWNQASMLSGPDRGEFAPQSASLVPVFRAMAVERQPPEPGAPDAARGVTFDRSPHTASFGSPVSDALRESTNPDLGQVSAQLPRERPAQRSGPAEDVGRG